MRARPVPSQTRLRTSIPEHTLNRFLLAAFVLTLALAHETSARAFWCGRRTVHIGDPQTLVRSLCGDPADVSEHVVSRTVGVRRISRDGVVLEDSVTVSVVVEVWLYDFGRRRFMEEVSFEEGRVTAIESLGYGTANGREARLEVPRTLSRRACAARSPRRGRGGPPARA
jgi:hypothetical protein